MSNPTPDIGQRPAFPQPGATLEITYHRVSEKDTTGMVNIDCTGPLPFHYACIGSHHGAQISEGDKEARVLAFGAAMSELVRKHFGAVRPLVDSAHAARQQTKG